MRRGRALEKEREYDTRMCRSFPSHGPSVLFVALAKLGGDDLTRQEQRRERGLEGLWVTDMEETDQNIPARQLKYVTSPHKKGFRVH